MGMDLYGKKALNETGEYFRNNVWWWRPLAIFVQDQYPTLTSKCKDWHSNSGYGLGKIDSRKLSRAIRVDISLGKVKEYEDKFNQDKKSKLKVKCRICDGTGIRDDIVGTEAGFPNKELDNEVIKVVGRNVGWCNGCEGFGETEHFDNWYSFSEENVIEFVNFLESSGGFKIC